VGHQPSGFHQRQSQGHIHRSLPSPTSRGQGSTILSRLWQDICLPPWLQHTNRLLHRGIRLGGSIPHQQRHLRSDRSGQNGHQGHTQAKSPAESIAPRRRLLASDNTDEDGPGSCDTAVQTQPSNSRLKNKGKARVHTTGDAPTLPEHCRVLALSDR
jgi:hypothetical protein